MEMFRSAVLEKEYLDMYDKHRSQFPVKTEERYIKSKWCDTYVLHCGNLSGTALVLLHCMGVTSMCWSANIKILAEKYNIYLIDVVGEPNRTVNHTNQVTFEEYIQWLDGTIQALGLEDINLAGWSFGGYLAVGYAIHYPERVGRLMAFSPAGTVSKLTIKFMMKLFPALISGKEAKIQAFWSWLCRETGRTAEYKLFCKGMQSYQGWARGTSIKVFDDKEFAALKMPCLILLGDTDPIYTGKVKKDAGRINKLNEKVHIEFVNGTHGFLIQNAEMASRKMLDFFN